MKCFYIYDNVRDVRNTYVVAQAKIYPLIWRNFSFISKVQLSTGKYTLIIWTTNIVLKREQKRIFLRILNTTGSIAMKYVILAIYLPYQVDCKREPLSSNIACTSKAPCHGRAFKISTALVYVWCPTTTNGTLTWKVWRRGTPQENHDRSINLLASVPVTLRCERPWMVYQ